MTDYTDKRLDSIDSAVNNLVEGVVTDIHQRVHGLERWQVKVDAFMEESKKQDVRNNEKLDGIYLSLESLSKTVWMFAGATMLAGVLVSVVIFMNGG